MSREVRKVPKDWEHPKREDGSYQPIFDQSYREAAEEWIEGLLLWIDGKHPDQLDEEYPVIDIKYYWDWAGSSPDIQYFRPDWREEERTHYQMYETTTEGTPISPVMESPEELARWLVENKASAFANMTATYEQWLEVCKGKTACSMIMANGKIMSGVEARIGSENNG